MENVQAFTNSEDFTRSISLPLFQSKGWLKFLGVMNIISGIPSIIILVGIINIWIGFLLFKAGDAADAAHRTGDPAQLLLALEKLRVYFLIQGILYALGIFVVLVYILIIVVFGVSLLGMR